MSKIINIHTSQGEIVIDCGEIAILESPIEGNDGWELYLDLKRIRYNYVFKFDNEHEATDAFNYITSTMRNFSGHNCSVS